MMCCLYCTSDLLSKKWTTKIITYRAALLLHTSIKILRYVRKFSSEANLTILAIILPGLEFFSDRNVIFFSGNSPKAEDNNPKIINNTSSFESILF